MMEIGCQTYSLRGRPGLEMLECVRKAGFRTIELWVGHADYAGDPASAARLRRAAERIGIRIQAYSVGGFVREGVAVVETRLTRAFAYAAELGVDLVTGVVDRRALPVVERLVERTGIRFAIENHWYADFARAGDFVKALRGVSPRVGITLDTGHLAVAGEDPLQALRRLGPRVMNIHLKDVTVPGRLGRWLWRRPHMESCTIGDGEVRLGALLGVVATDGYMGRLALEDERPNLPLSELHASLRACTGLMRGARAPVASSGAR